MASATQNGMAASRAKSPADMSKEELLSLVVENTKFQAEFVPYLETDVIKLNAGNVAKFVANKTKSGKIPSEAEIVNFISTCKALKLNPFVKDAFLVGYDTSDGPKFSIITAYQALLKRAEGHEHFDGMRGGIIVHREEDGVIAHRDGALRLPGDKLFGAWAKVWRKDRSQTTDIELEIGARLTERPSPIWKSDPCSMIVKCAKSAALREAFPSTLGGMYTEEEMDLMQHTSREEAGGKKRPATIAERVAAKSVVTAAEIHTEPIDESYQPSPEDEEIQGGYEPEESEVEA